MSRGGTPIPTETLGAPAERTLIGAGYTTLERLPQTDEAAINDPHGVGPNALVTLRAALDAHAPLGRRYRVPVSWPSSRWRRPW